MLIELIDITRNLDKRLSSIENNNNNPFAYDTLTDYLIKRESKRFIPTPTIQNDNLLPPRNKIFGRIIRDLINNNLSDEELTEIINNNQDLLIEIKNYMKNYKDKQKDNAG